MQKEKRVKWEDGEVWVNWDGLKEETIPWSWRVHPEGLLNYHVQVVQLLYGIVHGGILRGGGGDEGESEGMMTDSLSKLDPHTWRGSGTKSMVQFCPAAAMSAVPIRNSEQAMKPKCLLHV